MADEMEIIARHLDSPPVNIAGLIRELGITYRVEAMPPNQSGRIDHRGDGRFEITVNAYDGPQRQRFTAAHELAHYLLHRDMLLDRGHLDRLFDGSGGGSGPLSPQHEIQANKLAADLLMPANDVLATWGETRDVNAIANRFMVSPVAAQVRLKNLRLI